jgi:hypothetical protein
MQHRAVPLLLVSLLTHASNLTAQSVFEKDGNIFHSDADNRIVQLTTSGLDFEPSLAPSGALVVFARHTPGKLVGTGSGDVEAGEIWVVRADGRDAKRLAQGTEREPWEETLAGLQRPRFLSDNRRVVFQSLLWATSGKVNLVDIESGNVRRLMPGSVAEVVLDGKYRDHLIVSQHRYFLAGGSYDWYWLFDVDGKEIGPLGPDEGQIEMF